MNNSITVEGKDILLDKEGYLLQLTDWSKPVAEALATKEGISLTANHWEILNALRDFHSSFEHAPNNRILVKYIKEQLGSDKGTSIYIMKLFPNAPAKLAAKIAGIPRPTHCL